MAPKKRAPQQPKPRRPKDSGSVYPIKNRKGEVYAYLAELEINGRRERRRAATREGAEALLAELHELKRRGIDVGEGTQSLADWLPVWYLFQVKLHEQGEIATGTLNAYFQAVNLYLIPKLGHHRLCDIKQEHIQEFVFDLRVEIRDYYARRNAERIAAGKAPSRRLNDGAATVLKCAVVLKMALDLAVDRKLIPETPYRNIKLPKAPERKVPAPTVAQVARFLLAVRGHRWEPLMTIYALLGFRLGEGTGLRWSDYDPKAQTLTIAQQVQLRPKEGERKTRMERDDPKNDTSARTVPTVGPIGEMLDALRGAQLELRVRRADTWVPNDLIFCSRDGKPLWPSDVEGAFLDLWARAGLPAEHILHDLRKGVATMLDEADVTETQKAAILGHRKQTQTQRYVTARIESMRRVLDKVWAQVWAEMERQEAMG